MQPLLGMAGLAEAAWIYALGLLCFGLFAVTIIAVLGLTFRSRIASVIALVLVFFLSLLFMPWEAFRPVESDDPDVYSLMGSFQSLAVWWVVVSAGTIASVVWVFWRRRELEN
jgi:hypothetical protein